LGPRTDVRALLLDFDWVESVRTVASVFDKPAAHPVLDHPRPEHRGALFRQHLRLCAMAQLRNGRVHGFDVGPVRKILCTELRRVEEEGAMMKEALAHRCRAV